MILHLLAKVGVQAWRICVTKLADSSSKLHGASHVANVAFHRLKLKHKKCAPLRLSFVYMHDKVRVRIGERGGDSIYGSLTHHLLQNLNAIHRISIKKYGNTNVVATDRNT